MFFRGLYRLRYLEYSRVAQRYRKALQLLWLMSVITSGEGQESLGALSSASHSGDKGAGENGVS